jgi:uncharacterized protein YraI
VLLVLMACGNSGTGSLPSTPTPQAIAVTPIHAQAQIVVDTANLRTGAGLTYQQIGRLSKDTLVSVSGVSSDGNWYQVSAVDPQGASIQGWVAADFITYITPVPSSIALSTATPTPTGVASATAGQAAPVEAGPAQPAAPLADGQAPLEKPSSTPTVIFVTMPTFIPRPITPTPTIQPVAPITPTATATTLPDSLPITPTPTDTLVPVERPSPTPTTTITMVAPETPTDTLVPAETPTMTTTPAAATEDVPTATADEPIEPTPTDTVIPPATPTDTAPAVVPSVVTPVEATP